MKNEIAPNQSTFPSTKDTQNWVLTKKELFAGLALAGMLANPERLGQDFETLVELAETAANLLARDKE